MPQRGTRLQYGSYRLFPVYEKFCQHVVDAFGENEKKTLIRAYELANGLPPTPDEKVRKYRYDKASEWAKKPEIRGRCEEIEHEREALLTISPEKMISRNVKILEGDPLNLMKEDSETGTYIFRRLNEIPRNYRKLVTPTLVRGRMVYILDKKTAERNLIDILGLKKETLTHNVNRELSDIALDLGDFDQTDDDDLLNSSSLLTK